MNSVSIFFLCLIFVVVQQRIEAIDCYSCSAGTDGCGPIFSTRGAGVIPTTDSLSAYCIKDVYSSNTNAIARSYDAASCTEGSGNVGSGTTYSRYCCQTDLCNRAPMGKANFIFGVISTAILLLLIK